MISRNDDSLDFTLCKTAAFMTAAASLRSLINGVTAEQLEIYLFFILCLVTFIFETPPSPYYNRFAYSKKQIAQKHTLFNFK